MSAKLGLKITKSFTGFGTGFGMNESPLWTKFIRDTRDDYKCIPVLEQDSKASVLMYSATDAGEFFTLISGIAGRAGDFVSAWIFVPGDAEIEGRSLVKIIDETRAQILADEIDSDKLKTIFEQEYPDLEIPRICTKTSGVEYAVRYYGPTTDYALQEVVNLMSQPENSNYKAIFLIDKKTAIVPVGCQDITDHKLYDSYIVQAPGQVEGFVPYLDDKPFIHPVRVTDGDELTVIWKKKGYEDVETKTIITASNNKVNEPSPASFRKFIYSKDIIVRGEKGGFIPEEKYKVLINKEVLEKDSFVLVREALLPEVIVRICDCKGYEDLKETKDFTKNLPVRISLKEKCYSYVFEIPLKPELYDIANVDSITVESKEPLEHSPFEGYHSINSCRPSVHADNRLKYSPDKMPLWKRLIPIAIGLVVGMFVGYTVCYEIKSKEIAAMNRNFQSQIKETQKQVEKPKTPRATDLLDRNEWKREEFESVTELKGLWGALNEYKFDAVLQKGGDLDKSINFTDLKIKIKEFLECGGTRSNFGKGNYDKTGTIRPDNYINILNGKIKEIKRDKNKQGTGANNKAPQPNPGTDADSRENELD